MKLDEVLRGHGLRVTAPRRAVLELLLNSNRALAQHDVAQALPDIADRVTLFRVLQAFEEAGLAHRIMDANGAACYAACSTDCSSHKHADTHAHFHCADCGSVYCLENVELPKVRMPKGFTLKESHLELKGSCRLCA